jgi:hypothetical protein
MNQKQRNTQETLARSLHQRFQLILGVVTLMSTITALLTGIAGGISPTSASPIYVADPGRGFGPLRLTAAVPAGWTIDCQIGDRHEAYYARDGLWMEVAEPSPGGLRVRTILDILVFADRLNTDVIDSMIEDGECFTADGRPMTKSTPLPRVPDITYMTNRGVRLGATVSDVLAAHGTPARINHYDRAHPGRVTGIDYCGLTFGFDDLGRVKMITVENLAIPVNSQDCRSSP